jgi:hypothetical protein
MDPAFSIEGMTELLELREAVKWYKGVNAIVDPAGKIKALTEANKIAINALEDCTGGDLVSGEGIYKAEVAREALQKIKSVMGEDK